MSKSLTETDKLFEASAPGYYAYNTEVFSRNCAVCEKPFTTKLELNKFCTPEHKDLFLKRLAGIKE